MPTILCIETSSKYCSVCIGAEDKIISKIANTELGHAEVLMQLIQDALLEANISSLQLDAVALSAGPGSYTGLRIGTSTAQGICYSLQIPLIAIDTLKIIAHNAQTMFPTYKYYWSMIDARRMEVYHSIFDNSNNPLFEAQNYIINTGSLDEFKDLLNNATNKDVLLCGDGALKCNDYLPFDIDKTQLIASMIYPLAKEYYANKLFESVAYFNPNYIKYANITQSKK